MVADVHRVLPENHTGMAYWEFLSEITAKRRVKRYLEIGVQEGRLLSMINTDFAIGVDPFFNLNHNIVRGKKKVTLFQGTSDEFFSSPDCSSMLDDSPNFVFLDGMHTFEYLLRDFYNVEAISNRNTLVALHDCLPLSEEMIDRDETRSILSGSNTRFANYWTGDVWKLIPILKEFRPDLKLIAVDAAPTGLVFITNLNPKSTILYDNYIYIVEKYISMENNKRALDEMYSNLEIIPTNTIINNFDNSLFFRL